MGLVRAILTLKRCKFNPLWRIACSFCNKSSTLLVHALSGTPCSLGGDPDRHARLLNSFDGYCDGSGDCVECYCDSQCDDSVSCTDDSCNLSTNTCINTPTDANCDDGLFCNGAETCSATGCQAGTPPDCSDPNECTDDSCQEGSSSHVCVNAPKTGDSVR